MSTDELLRHTLDLLQRLEYAGLYAEHPDDSWSCCPTCGGADPATKYLSRYTKKKHRRGCEMQKIRKALAAALAAAAGGRA